MYFVYAPYTICIIDSSSYQCESCSSVCLSDLSAAETFPTYYTCLFVVIFLPLLLIFLITYGMIAWKVWGARIQSYRNGDTSPQTTISTTETTVSASPTSLNPPTTAHTKKKIRTFKVVLIIMLTFFVCRLPQWTFNLVSLYVPVGGWGMYILRYSLSALTVFNTAINPLLYSFLNSVLDVNWRFFKCF